MPILKIPKNDERLCYFLTLTTIEWINIFTKKQYFEILIKSLKFCQTQGLKIHGYVFMTNHLHLMVSATKKPLSTLIQSFKRHTTTEIKKALKNDRRKYLTVLIKNSFSKRKISAFQIWQEGNYPISIESEKFLYQKLNYIHNNPVKEGYVDKPEDWRYSSARNYELNDDFVIRIDKEWF